MFGYHLNGLGRERQWRLGGRCREVARLYEMSLTRIETESGEDSIKLGGFGR